MPWIQSILFPNSVQTTRLFHQNEYHRDPQSNIYLTLKKRTHLTLQKEHFLSQINDTASIRVHHARWHASKCKFPRSNRNIITSKTNGKTDGNKPCVKEKFTWECAVLHTRKSRTKREAALWMKQGKWDNLLVNRVRRDSNEREYFEE